MSASDPAEKEVRAIGRDPVAFEAFYRRQVRMVTGFVARRVADPCLVDDLTTEVFLAAIEGSDGYRRRLGSESAWLVGIAHNVLAAERRRAARQLDKTLRAAGRRVLDGDDITRLEERIDAERAGRRLLTELDRLPAGLRAVIELVDMDGLTVTEAAAALRIRPGTARVRLHRARRILRDHPGVGPGSMTVEGAS
ncbi:RNA polymerase sigma factor [Actinoallomurus soli]|uniref:RNA polymerase sigma factor n=1 Tax=Actinoallomurus soli TaxID=2952535 RepID=UPI002092C5A3|nr:RNA polymerase sigma factor [Actinoallomurus soli]MCO5967824.1 RNA polymerase sigma factor [Actinoallomurus soli]